MAVPNSDSPVAARSPRQQFRVLPDFWAQVTCEWAAAASMALGGRRPGFGLTEQTASHREGQLEFPSVSPECLLCPTKGGPSGRVPLLDTAPWRMLLLRWPQVCPSQMPGQASSFDSDFSMRSPLKPLAPPPLLPVLSDMDSSKPFLPPVTFHINI